MSLPPRDAVGAVVTAGGSGVRFGGLKQFTAVAGRPALVRAVDLMSEFAGRVVVPVPAGQAENARALLEGRSATLCEGGPTRALSVLAGLETLRQTPGLSWVLVHDAARPWATPALVERVLSAALRVGAALPALPVTDTVKRAAGDLVVETLDRASLRLVQTPQAFGFTELLAAYEQAGPAARDRTDDAAVYAALGLPVAWVEGEHGNRKLTRPEDLSEPRAQSATPRTRIGVGYDVHPFAAGRPLVLAGLPFDGDGLAGDSDADIVAHAVTDALLGAAALGDLGSHFPPGDPRFQGARSLDLLAAVVRLCREAGYRVGNVDLTVAARRPRLSGRARAMAESLAAVLDVEPGQVSVKATSGDGLGFVGRSEGIAVHAVVLLWGEG